VGGFVDVEMFFVFFCSCSSHTAAIFVHVYLAPPRKKWRAICPKSALFTDIGFPIEFRVWGPIKNLF
jgi:hypothetical protein